LFDQVTLGGATYGQVKNLLLPAAFEKDVGVPAPRLIVSVRLSGRESDPAIDDCDAD